MHYVGIPHNYRFIPCYVSRAFLQAWPLVAGAVTVLPCTGGRTAGHVLGFVGLSHVGSPLRVADRGDIGGHVVGGPQRKTVVCLLTVTSRFRWVLGDVWCSIVCGTNYCLIIVSMLTLCFISLDRYVAIHHSLRYHHLVTRSRTFLLLLYSWLQGLSFGLVPVLCGWVRYDYWEATCAISWHLFGRPVLIYVIIAFIFCFFLPSVVLAVAYCKVLRTTQKIQPRPRPTVQLESLGHPFCQDGPTLSHSGVASFRNRVAPSHSRVSPLHNGVAPSHSRTAPSHSGAAPSEASPSHSEASPSHNEAVPSHHGAAPSNSESSPSHSRAPSHRPAELARWPQRRAKYSESSKAVRSLLIVMLAYFVCLTPFSVTKLYKVIVSNPSGLPGYASLLATFFQYLSSVVNPLIYGLFRRDFQKAFLYLLRSVRYRRSDISSNHHSSGSF